MVSELPVILVPIMHIMSARAWNACASARPVRRWAPSLGLELLPERLEAGELHVGAKQLTVQ